MGKAQPSCVSPGTGGASVGAYRNLSTKYYIVLLFGSPFWSSECIKISIPFNKSFPLIAGTTDF